MDVQFCFFVREKTFAKSARLKKMNIQVIHVPKTALRMIYLQCVKLYGFNYRNNVTSTTGLITFVHEPRKGLYVHIILSDTRFGVGLGPLAELLLTLGEVP